MRFQVKLTAHAERDVEATLQWFDAQSATATGARWLTRLMQCIDRLETNPTRCGLAPEASSLGIEIREMHFGRRRGTYRILFQISGETVYFLRIRHGARDEITEADL